MHIGQAIAINCMFLRPILKMQLIQLTQLTQLTLDFFSSAQSCEGKLTSRHAQDMQSNTAVEVKCCASRMTDWQGGRRGCRRGSSGGVGMNFLTFESINHQHQISWFNQCSIGSARHQKNMFRSSKKCASSLLVQRTWVMRPSRRHGASVAFI